MHPLPLGTCVRDLMTSPGLVSDHLILANEVGENHSFGCVVGRIAPAEMTFGSLMTEVSRLKLYLGEDTFTEDEIPADFFGCAGVAEVERLQDVLLHVGRNGYRHHVSVTRGRHLAPVREALESYLGCDVAVPQEA